MNRVSFRLTAQLVFVLMGVFLTAFLISSATSSAFTVSQHIITGRAMGRAADSPEEAFVLGFLSHALFDYTKPQHYILDFWNPEKKDMDLILLEALISLYVLNQCRNNKLELYAVAGALLPDIIDGALSIANQERWYEGDHLFPWHDRRNVENMTKEETMGLSLTLFAANFAF